MCIIIVKPSGVDLPKDEWIINSDAHNSDGIGIAYQKKSESRVKIKKDFSTAQELIDWLKENISKEDNLILHFRWATSGKTDAGNRHPFPLTLNKSLLRKTELKCLRAVAHNGVLNDFSGDTKYSDTQKFVMERLAQKVVKENLFDETMQFFIKEYIGTDKLAFLDYEKGLLLIGNFVKEDGCYFSNETYKAPRYNYLTTGHSQYYNRQPYYAKPPQHYTHGGYFEDNWDDEYPQKELLDFKNNKPENKLKNGVWVDKCDGCGEKKYIKTVLADEVVLYLCKKCRKKYKRKGKEALKKDFIDPEGWEACDSCNLYYPPDKLTQFQTGVLYCESCMRTFQLATQGRDFTNEDESIIEDSKRGAV